MARASVKVLNLSKGRREIERAVEKATMKAMKFAMKDLERVASETAPLDEGDLEMGGVHDVDTTSKGLKGWVWFEAWNDNPDRSYDFNYAVWTHEQTYNLGPKSKKKGSGSGLSGKTYPVGNKYLTRPLEGESPFYRDKIEEEVKESLKRLG